MDVSLLSVAVLFPLYKYFEAAKVIAIWLQVRIYQNGFYVGG